MTLEAVDQDDAMKSVSKLPICGRMTPYSTVALSGLARVVNPRVLTTTPSFTVCGSMIR